MKDESQGPLLKPEAGAPEDPVPGEVEKEPQGGAEQTASGVADTQKLLAEKRELYDRLLRKQAELENYRKRVQREKEEFQELASASLVRALLPVLDGFERALQHRDSGVPEQFFQGVELIHKQLLEVLGRAGLRPLETVGKIFNPHDHQAVETVESSTHRDHEIVEELQRGYKLKHRLLRPAVVKVAVRPPEEKPRPGAVPKARGESSD